MRRSAAALLSLCLAAPVTAAEPDAAGQRLGDLALDCIRLHAPEVERVEPSLTEATNFLLDDLCHAQITTHDRYVANTKLITEMRSPHNPYSDLIDLAGESASKADRERVRQQSERTRAAWQSASVDPVTGDLRGQPSDPAEAGMATFYIIASNRASHGEISEVFRTAAAEAVLAARTVRLAK